MSNEIMSDWTVKLIETVTFEIKNWNNLIFNPNFSALFLQVGSLF